MIRKKKKEKKKEKGKQKEKTNKHKSDKTAILANKVYQGDCIYLC